MFFGTASASDEIQGWSCPLERRKPAESLNVGSTHTGRQPAPPRCCSCAQILHVYGGTPSPGGSGPEQRARRWLHTGNPDGMVSKRTFQVSRGAPARKWIISAQGFALHPAPSQGGHREQELTAGVVPQPVGDCCPGLSGRSQGSTPRSMDRGVRCQRFRPGRGRVPAAAAGFDSPLAPGR